MNDLNMGKAVIPQGRVKGGSMETVLSVKHWTEDYFSFTCTRSDSLRFVAGQFVMIGLEDQGKIIKRAYSIANAPWEEHLEFFSIKVEAGAFTSKLQHIKPGDAVWVSEKPVGTLVLHDLKPGKRLWMLSTGTGIAPFLSIAREPDLWEGDFESVILIQGVRHEKDLAYRALFEETLYEHEYFGPLVKDRLHYLPIVSREPFVRQGRLTTLLGDDALLEKEGLTPLNPETDRMMICGSPSMLSDTCALLDKKGFVVSPSQGVQGDYVFERAFVER